MRRLLLLLCAAACGRYGFDLDGAGMVPDASETTATCTFGPWQPPVNLGLANGTGDDWSPTLSDDGLELIFERSASTNDDNLFRAVRATPTGVFGTATPISELNTASYEGNPSLSADRLTLYFSSNRDGVGLAGLRIYRATRTDVNGTFGTPTLVPGLEDVAANGPAISASGDELFYTDTGWTTITRAVWNGSSFSVVGIVTELGTSTSAFPDLSRDGLTIYFDRNTSQIYSATRSAPGSTFSTPAVVPNISTSGASYDADLGHEDRQLVFASTRSSGLGGADIWISTRACE